MDTARVKSGVGAAGISRRGRLGIGVLLPARRPLRARVEWIRMHKLLAMVNLKLKRTSGERPSTPWRGSAHCASNRGHCFAVRDRRS